MITTQPSCEESPDVRTNRSVILCQLCGELTADRPQSSQSGQWNNRPAGWMSSGPSEIGNWGYSGHPTAQPVKLLKHASRPRTRHLKFNAAMFHEQLHVFPDELFGVCISKQVGWVVGAHDLSITVLEHLSP